MTKPHFTIYNGRKIPYRDPETLKEAESKGLGDTIKKVTGKMGIKQCGGCKKRQAALNKLFPYKDKDIKET